MLVSTVVKALVGFFIVVSAFVDVLSDGFVVVVNDVAAGAVGVGVVVVVPNVRVGLVVVKVDVVGAVVAVDEAADVKLLVEDGNAKFVEVPVVGRVKLGCLVSSFGASVPSLGNVEPPPRVDNDIELETPDAVAAPKLKPPG